VDREGWGIEWGFLVLNDRKLLAVDGAHKLSRYNWSVLAEAERSGVVTIVKAAKSSAYARTRQIKIANAVDEEEGKYSTKTLSSFLYPCQALTTILDKTSIARLDLAVFSDQRDVEATQINVAYDGVYDPDLHLLSEVTKWVWSGSTDIHFTNQARETLLREATELYKEYYCGIIPLVSIDMKWKLARLSAALANLTLSTDDFRAVNVTAEHVNAVVEILKNEYIESGLSVLAAFNKHEIMDTFEIGEMLARILNSLVKTAGDFGMDRLKRILRYICNHGRVTKDELRARFSLSDNNETRPLIAALKSESLIKVGRGYYPTPKLIQAHKVSGAFTSS
jgi:hypothetical protein